MNEGEQYMTLRLGEPTGARRDSILEMLRRICPEVALQVAGDGTVTTKEGETHRLGYEDTIDTWMPRLEFEDRLVREGAVQALGWLTKTKEDKDKVVPMLIEALRDEVMEVRRNAAEALGRIGDPRAIDALNQALTEDKENWVREVAEESIGLIKEQKQQQD
jgi:HEAT repeat protein